MPLSIPIFDFNITAEERQFLISERERKAKEEKEAKDKLRIKRNKEAAHTHRSLETACEAARDSLRTLSIEIGEREQEIKEGDKLWRWNLHEVGATIKAVSGFEAAKSLKVLCMVFEKGLTALSKVASFGVANVNTHGFEGSSTFLSTCRASPAIAVNIQAALGGMSGNICELEKELMGIASSKVEEGESKRKRI